MDMPMGESVMRFYLGSIDTEVYDCLCCGGKGFVKTDLTCPQFHSIPRGAVSLTDSIFIECPVCRGQKKYTVQKKYYSTDKHMRECREIFDSVYEPLKTALKTKCGDVTEQYLTLKDIEQIIKNISK